MKGIRAAVCHDVHSAHQCVEHDDVNVMCIGAQIVGPRLAKDLVAAYLDAKFSTDEEFRRRVAKLAEINRGVEGAARPDMTMSRRSTTAICYPTSDERQAIWASSHCRHFASISEKLSPSPRQ